ncbi:CRE-ZYG-12 protein [Caenorhabditis remanei]|uniref:Protein hook n=1 Tax=Caenorhabditis remanei TaxID=31234 RepID=E3M4B0_CAERE|nr:CRE-ZYG-12 protein [Caenorhabditis remanei]
MLDLTNPDSDASENGNSKYADSSDGQGVGTSRKPEVDKFTLEERRKDLADLAIWLSGLNGTKLALDDPHSLCNGRAFAELLHVIDDSFFDERWLETMPGMRTTSNLVVKRSNIRKLWRKISDYYSMLGRNIGQRWYEIGERVDNIEETDIPVAVDLAMAVVAIALIGTRKEKWISYSQEFAKTYRNEMTNVARMVEIVVKEMPELSDNVTFHEISDLHDSQNELNCSQPESSVVSNKNGFGERRRSSSNNDQVLVEAQQEIDSLRSEKDSLLKEVERLTKASDNAQFDDSISSAVTILEKQNEELRIKRRQMEEKTLELEAALEHFQSTVKKLTEENDTLQSSQKEFNMLRSHLDSAQSDVEEWRAKANQYQTDAELGKKREKEVKELQGQVSSLTSRLAHLIKTATEDEDNKAGIMQLRSQLGTITANNVELNVALESKQRIVEQLEIQLIQYKEKVKELEDRKEDLIAERNELENQLHFKDQVTPRSLHESMFEAGNLSFEPFSEKSKLPLEIENKRLAERIHELEALEPLKGEIITMRSQNGLLEEQKLVIKKQMEELERQVAELQEKLALNQKNASGDSVELRIQLEKANVEVERMKEAEMRAETKLADVKELLQKRNAEYEANEKALERAKSVIDEMEDRCRPVGEDSITSVQAFKEMKEENERLRQKVEKYEIDLNTTTQSYEQENRLITSAAYQQVSFFKNQPRQTFSKVLDRSSDAVMSMRAQGGTDAPRTMLDAQKANSALPWR